MLALGAVPPAAMLGDDEHESPEPLIDFDAMQIGDQIQIVKISRDNFLITNGQTVECKPRRRR